MLIFECSVPGRNAVAQLPIDDCDKNYNIPEALLRKQAPGLPEVSELQVVRHYTNLSRLNYSIDTHFYPLGSCTMKYNPKGIHEVAQYSGFVSRHPLAPLELSQGYLACVWDLQETLLAMSGMQAVSLVSMAGAQGEFAGVSMIKAYHESRGDTKRCEVIVPDAAHGTNPASAIMCGYKVVEVPTLADGDVDFAALENLVSEKTAAIMLTNPSTLGIFERKITAIAKLVHDAGGLLYYDGANLNAILGKVRPGDMGFDVMHFNLHKTFATPHGGGGPGCGPVACNTKLQPYLPVPVVGKVDNQYVWLDESEFPETIGRLTTFMGNAGIILRAFAYGAMLGGPGLRSVAEYATLNANYLMHELEKAGIAPTLKGRRASHEFVISFADHKREYQVTAMDIAKRLLDYGFHAPTTYFPLLVPECFLIEPTETEAKQTLDLFVTALKDIVQEVMSQPEKVRQAPHNCVLGRLDEVKAARELDIAYCPG